MFSRIALLVTVLQDLKRTQEFNTNCETNLISQEKISNDLDKHQTEYDKLQVSTQPRSQDAQFRSCIWIVQTNLPL